MERQGYIDLLQQLKLPTIANEFDEIMIEGVGRKRPTIRYSWPIAKLKITQRKINQTLERIKDEPHLHLLWEGG